MPHSLFLDPNQVFANVFLFLFLFFFASKQRPPVRLGGLSKFGREFLSRDEIGHRHDGLNSNLPFAVDIFLRFRSRNEKRGHRSPSDPEVNLVDLATSVGYLGRSHMKTHKSN